MTSTKRNDTNWEDPKLLILKLLANNSTRITQMCLGKLKERYDGLKQKLNDVKYKNGDEKVQSFLRSYFVATRCIGLTDDSVKHQYIRDMLIEAGVQATDYHEKLADPYYMLLCIKFLQGNKVKRFVFNDMLEKMDNESEGTHKLYVETTSGKKSGTYYLKFGEYSSFFRLSFQCMEHHFKTKTNFEDVFGLMFPLLIAIA